MDVGVLMICHLDRVCWDALVDEQSPYNVCVPVMYGQAIANHFVASQKGDPFIKRWHDLLLHVWKGRTNHSGLFEHPLLQWASSASLGQLKTNSQRKWKVDGKTVFGYAGQVMCWRRLTYLEDVGDSFRGAGYWEKNIPTSKPSTRTGEPRRLLGSLARSSSTCSACHLDPSSTEHAEAFNLVWRLLTRRSLQGVVRGKGLTEDLMLRILWDLPENELADCAPGTFAWLLRQGSLHFRQTRNSMKVIPAEPVSERWKKGMFEP